MATKALLDESKKALQSPAKDPMTGLVAASAYAHLVGRNISSFPNISLQIADSKSHSQEIKLHDLVGKPFVLAAQPGASSKACTLPEGWMTTKGAPGCTGQALGFNEKYEEIASLGCEVYALSTKSSERQHQFATERGIKFKLISDSQLILATLLGLPCSTLQNTTYIERATLVIAADGTIVNVFHSIEKPAENVTPVVQYLQANKDMLHKKPEVSPKPAEAAPSAGAGAGAAEADSYGKVGANHVVAHAHRATPY